MHDLTVHEPAVHERVPVIGRRLLLGAGAAMVAGRARAAGMRLISLGGAVTESVYAVGAGDWLVGSDLTSEYPAQATHIPRVGYLRNVGAEGLLSLRPDLVLASSDAGPPAALSQVEAAQVAVIMLPEAHAPETAVLRVRRIGAALDRVVAAAAVETALQADLAQVLGAVPRPGAGGPRVLFLLSAGRGAPMAAGTATAADAMIRLAGATNAVDGYTGYKPMSAEAVLLAAPDVVVTTTQTLDGVGGESGLRQAVPGLASEWRVVAFDGLFLLGFGPRLAHALRALTLALHPGLDVTPLPPRAWAV